MWSSAARRESCAGFLRQLGELYYPCWDWDEPPFFNCFLRVDATADEVGIRCFAATGCAEHEAEPPLEDEVRWRAAFGW